jgi:phage terminase small subunit
MAASKDELTPKQQAFVREYLVDFNATQAAIRAGYSAKTAVQSGFENLRKPDIQTEIKRHSAERHEKLELTADRVLSELMQIAFANIGDYFPADGSAFNLAKLTRAQKAALEITVDKASEGGKSTKRVRIRLADKTRALELLGKRLKLWVDRHEVVGLADWEDFGERVQAMRRQMDGNGKRPN